MAVWVVTELLCLLTSKPLSSLYSLMVAEIFSTSPAYKITTSHQQTDTT